MIKLDLDHELAAILTFINETLGVRKCTFKKILFYPVTTLP